MIKTPFVKGGTRRNPWFPAFTFSMTAVQSVLGGTSAWLLGSVAIAGLSTAAFTFNFHIPAALIRLFALGRTASRYAERLTGHKAALDDQIDHRTQLFSAMSDTPVVRQAGWQLGHPAWLADYLDDVEDLDYGQLRVDLPLLSVAVAFVLGLIATAIVTPLALFPIVFAFLTLLAAGMRLARKGATTWDAVRLARRAGAEQLGGIMTSAIPLLAERTWSAECDKAFDAFVRADSKMLALRREQTHLDTLTGLFAPLAALSIIGAAWFVGARSEALLVPAFVAFTWLSFGGSIDRASRNVVAWLRYRAACTAIGKSIGAALGQNRSHASNAHAFPELSHSALQLKAPDGRPLGSHVALRLTAGHPTVIMGQSGCGKTSLLKQIAGWTGDDDMTAEGKAVSATERRACSMMCLHDAAILADTARANLFAPSRSDTEIWVALAAVEIEKRIHEVGELNGWITQDTLSLGEAQRLNLARAWLSDKAIVLLDEPTEHLDAEQGERILARLLGRLQNQIVVLATHQNNASQVTTIITL